MAMISAIRKTEHTKMQSCPLITGGKTYWLILSFPLDSQVLCLKTSHYEEMDNLHTESELRIQRCLL